MSQKNRFGLSRTIPESIKLKIRQNSKFGCVVPNCRNAFYEYEHIIPEFKDAHEHDAEKICLVCPNHNPRRTGKSGQENYSKLQIQEFYKWAKSRPKVPAAINKDFFNGFQTEPTIVLGGCTFQQIQSIINIDGNNVFSFQENKNVDPYESPITFSGNFWDSEGKELFHINENEWYSPTYHWDVQVTNGEISIWDSTKSLVFRAIKKPQQNIIEITSLILWFPPFQVKIDGGELFIGRYSEDLQNSIHISVNAQFKHGNCGIYLNSRELFSTPVYAGFNIIGGGGISLNGNGIWIGRSAGVFYLKGFSIIPHGNIPQAAIIRPEKKVVPPKDAHYFVVGELRIETIQFPTWTEDRYYINGQLLFSKPTSWGQISADGRQLFYIDRNEESDLSENSGFIGFYADDVLEQEWSDTVFEVIVEDADDYKDIVQLRVKRADIAGRKIISEINPETSRYYHPHEFSGCSPWKKREGNLNK